MGVITSSMKFRRKRYGTKNSYHINHCVRVFTIDIDIFMCSLYVRYHIKTEICNKNFPE